MYYSNKNRKKEFLYLETPCCICTTPVHRDDLTTKRGRSINFASPVPYAECKSVKNDVTCQISSNMAIAKPSHTHDSYLSSQKDSADWSSGTFCLWIWWYRFWWTWHSALLLRSISMDNTTLVILPQFSVLFVYQNCNIKIIFYLHVS